MTGKHDNGKQVMQENVNNEGKYLRKDDVNNNHDSVANSNDSTNTLATDEDMRRAPLSRGSTLDSIKEEDDSTSLDERLMFENFKSITDIFENECKNDAQVGDEKNVSSLPRTSHTDSLISEDADSLDEEVRTIMLKSEEKRRQNQVKLLHMVKIPSEKENKAKVDTDDRGNAKEDEDKKLNEVKREDFLEEIEDHQDVVHVSDTESSSESESESNESDEDDNKSVTQWSLNKNDEGSSSDQEEFDLDSYLTKLCNESSDSGSEFDDDSTTMSDPETKRAVRKVMKPYMKKFSREDSDDSRSASEDDDYENESESEKEDQDDEGDEGDDDYSSVVSSSGTISDFFDDDSASVSTASSTDSHFGVDDQDELDAAESSRSLTDEPPYVPEPTIASHELVYKYYLSNRSESTPNKIELHNGEIGHNLGLENTLTSRSVVNLRWPYSNYYVKEFKLDSDKVPIKDEGLLPSYKSIKSSASFPGRRRNVMLGRVWWVEWWAEDALEDEKVEENKDGYGVEDNLEEVEKLDHFKPEKQNSHL